MGLLKLGSIYKKKNKKESFAPPLPTKQEPVALSLNLKLDNSSSIGKHNNNPTMPAGSGSLFDDIFAELGTKPAAPVAAVATVATSPVELASPKPATKGNKNKNKNKDANDLYNIRLFSAG